MKYEKIVKFAPAFDKRHKDPNKNYGIGSMRVWFILKGKEGAVQAMFSLPIYLPQTITEYKKIGNKNKTNQHDLRDDFDGNPAGIDCWDIGYHSLKPQYEGQTKGTCDILKGDKCYYDGSSLRGQQDKLGEMLLTEGQEPIWNYLEKDYKSRFGTQDNEE